MLIAKHVAKFEHSWISDPKLRAEIYGNFYIKSFSEKKIFYRSHAIFFNPRNDFTLSIDQAWSFLVGMIFPHRNICGTAAYCQEFHSLGKKIGMNGNWLSCLEHFKYQKPKPSLLFLPRHEILQKYLDILNSDLYYNQTSLDLFLPKAN